MSDRKPFLLRMDKAVLDALQRWADDELRSVNGQIEFLLAKAVKEAGRAPRQREVSAENDEPGTEESPS